MTLTKTSKPERRAAVATMPRLDLADLWDEGDDEHADWLANKREDVAITLTGLLHERQLSRADLARALGWKPSRVSRALSGRENLTINTLAEIIGATGEDFDFLIRKRGAARAMQPWERAAIIYSLFDLHTELTERVEQAKDHCTKAEAILTAASTLNRALFRRGSQIPGMQLLSNGKAMNANFSMIEDNDACFARQA